ncbi:MAG: hypothetical protein QY320_05180 [Gammaproteobacteria bacterium]|nr:MAG: hypothetical protein QY320_05180 [Gammaproteobacteria bacterium]
MKRCCRGSRRSYSAVFSVVVGEHPVGATSVAITAAFLAAAGLVGAAEALSRLAPLLHGFVRRSYSFFNW